MDGKFGVDRVLEWESCGAKLCRTMGWLCGADLEVDALAAWQFCVYLFRFAPELNTMAVVNRYVNR